MSLPMNPHDLIYVAGHRGLVGSSIVQALRQQGYTNLLVRTKSELDLTDPAATLQFFLEHRPRFVFVAAARVGGIGANRSYPADFLRQNLLIELNVLEAARLSGVEKLLLLGSSCIYPQHAPQPLKTEYVLTGHLDPNTAPYAIAKIAGLYLCQTYRAQYGSNFIYATPSNLYGVADNWDLETGHVLAALMRKTHRAKVNAEPQLTIWGDGSPYREFLLNEDLADACIFLMNHYDGPENVNIGSGEEVRIADLARLIQQVVGWQGEWVFDADKPNGTPRKLLDSSLLHSLGWRPKHKLATGIPMVYDRVFLQPDGPFYGRV